MFVIATRHYLSEYYFVVEPWHSKKFLMFSSNLTALLKLLISNSGSSCSSSINLSHVLTQLLIVQSKTFDIIPCLWVWFVWNSSHCLLIVVKLYGPLLVKIERCLLVGSWFCIVAMGNLVGAQTPVRYWVGVCYWECPFMEVLLYVSTD